MTRRQVSNVASYVKNSTKERCKRTLRAANMVTEHLVQPSKLVTKQHTDSEFCFQFVLEHARHIATCAVGLRSVGECKKKRVQRKAMNS